jgi:hypothetical protein
MTKLSGVFVRFSCAALPTWAWALGRHRSTFTATTKLTFSRPDCGRFGRKPAAQIWAAHLYEVIADHSRYCLW